MSCPSVEQWDLLSMNLIGGRDEAEMLAHAQDCTACRAVLRQARQDHAQLLQGVEKFQRRHDALRAELLAALPAGLPQRTLRAPGPRLARRTRWVVAILAPAACLLAAVGLFLVHGRGGVAFAAVLERMRQARTMVCDVTSVATTVLEADNRTETHTSHQRLAMYADGAAHLARIEQTDPAITQWVLPDRVVRVDADGAVTSVRFEEQPVLFARYELPNWWHERLLKLTDAPDRTLGTEVVDGREAIGFEIAGWKLGYGSQPIPTADATAGPTAVVRVWVDAGTHLPVRIQIEHVLDMRMPGVFSMKVSQTWEHIEYDVPLDLQLFQPPAPSVASASVQEPEPADVLPQVAQTSEEQFVEAMRAYPQQIRALLGDKFVDDLPRFMEQQQQRANEPQAAQGLVLLGDLRTLLGNGYPPQLDATFLSSVMMKITVLAPSLERSREVAARARGDVQALARRDDERAAAAGDADAAARVAEAREPARKELERKFAELASSVAALQTFYQQLLMQEQAPVYFGAAVKPGDANAVLMRWKLDNENGRVIYGDLHAATVPVDEQTRDTR